MKHASMKLRDVFTVTGILLLLAATLPLLAVAALAGRFALVGGALLAIPVGIVLYAFSPAFREWLGSKDELEVRYSGLRLATDVALHPGHGWARFDDAGVTVGADDLVPSLLGPIEEVTLPAPGRAVARGEPLFSLRRGDRSVSLRAPVSGVVLRTNQELRQAPELVNESPFGDGWAVQIAGPGARSESRALLRGARARAWFRREVDRLLESLLPDGVAPVLPDGGLLVHELYRQIDEATWRQLRTALFDNARDAA